MGRTKWLAVAVIALLLTVLGARFLVSIAEHKQEAEQAFFEVVDIAPGEPDPAVWGQNFPRQYEAHLKTARTAELIDYEAVGRYGGPEPFSRLERYPQYTRLFAGYAFSYDYDEDRGHMSALNDMLESERLGDKKPGPCMTCKSSQVPQMMAELEPEGFYASSVVELVDRFNPEFSIGCADCHDADTMALRVPRPALIEAKERQGVDLAAAGHQEMRTYVCAQCHVEYYFSKSGNYLVFPWDKGMTIEDIEAYYDEIDFADWTHAETQARLVKMQHPDYEMWSSGIHAQAGVACADCHMAYRRDGALKVSDHWVRSPMDDLSVCGTCHQYEEEELRAYVLKVQDRTRSLMARAEQAILDLQDAVILAMEKGVPFEALEEARRLHRKAFIRLDFVSAESSMGFHSPQEAARVLGDAIDYARQGQLAAYKAMGGEWATDQMTGMAP